MKKKIYIDDFFKEKITQVFVEFDEQAWEDLEAQLDKKKRKDRLIVWWWHWEKVAAIFVFGLLGYGSFYFLQKPTHKQAISDIKFISEKKVNIYPKTYNKPQNAEIEKQNIQLHTETSLVNKQKTLKKPHQEATIETNREEVAHTYLDRNLQARNLKSSFQIGSTKLNFADTTSQFEEDEAKNLAKVAHKFGFALSPVLSPNGLQAGLGYTHEFGISECTSLVSGVAYTPWTGTSNIMADNAGNLVYPSQTDNNVRLQTLEIPLEAKIKIVENLSVSSGISNTLLLQEKAGEVINNDFEWSITSLNLGLQYDIRIGKNSQLNLQPYYRFPLQSIGSAGTQISGFGLRAGYSYGKGRKSSKTIDN